jgi:putative transposase
VTLGGTMVSSVNRAVAGPDAVAGGVAEPAGGGDAAGGGPGPGGTAAAGRVPLRDLMDDRLLDALLERSRDEAGGLRLTGEGSMLGELVKAVLERALEGELTAHLGYERGERAGRGGGPANYRNGSIAKTVQTGVGPVGLQVPRDRAGTFEPLLIPKRSGRVAGGLDDMIISLYAHGMSVRDILHHLEQVYGTQLSAETVSRITDGVLEEVRAWQSRPLDPVYAVVFPAAIWAGSATATWCRTSPPTWPSASTPTGRSTCWASGWPRRRPGRAPPGRAPGSGAASWPT